MDSPGRRGQPWPQCGILPSCRQEAAAAGHTQAMYHHAVAMLRVAHNAAKTEVWPALWGCVRVRVCLCVCVCLCLCGVCVGYVCGRFAARRSAQQHSTAATGHFSAPQGSAKGDQHAAEGTRFLRKAAAAGQEQAVALLARLEGKSDEL